VVRPDSSICAEFEVDVTTLPNQFWASNFGASYTFAPLPCASILVYLRGPGPMEIAIKGGAEGADCATAIPVGTVFLQAANESLGCCLASSARGEEWVEDGSAVFYRAHVNLANPSALHLFDGI
jgi:hypothetical protein